MDGAAVSLITEEMQAAVGSEIQRLVSFPVSESDIRRWVTAVYFPEEPPSEFWDPAHAIVAPEEFNPFAWMVAEPHGHRTGYVPGAPSTEAKLGIAEPPTEFQLNGGAEIEFGAPIKAGDVITSSTVLSGYEERSGRLGTMLFTRFTDRWLNQADEVVKTTMTLLIRY